MTEDDLRACVHCGAALTPRQKLFCSSDHAKEFNSVQDKKARETKRLQKFGRFWERRGRDGGDGDERLVATDDHAGATGRS